MAGPRRRNRLITRGMGRSPDAPGVVGMITGGMGGLFLTKQVERLVRVGRSSARRAVEGLEEILIWARLIRVNDAPPPVKIEGFIRVGIDRTRRYAVTLVEGASVRVKNAYDRLKITVTRLK